MKKFIDEQLEDLIKSGSDKSILQYKNQIENELKHIGNQNPSQFIDSISIKIKQIISEYLDSKNEEGVNYATGLSLGIYMPTKTGEYKLKYFSGTNNQNIEINSETKFDIASINKMLTLFLIYNLVEYGFISLTDKLANLDSTYLNYGDFTISEVLLMCGESRTKNRVADGKNKEEALKILETVYLYSNDKTMNTYSDIGIIILSQIITKQVNKQLNSNMTYHDIMEKFLLKPFGLNETVINPTGIVAGNGNNLNLPHDPKAKLFNENIGSAGVFSTSEDLINVAKNLFSVNYINYDKFKHIIDKKTIDELSEVKFPNSIRKNMTLSGMYVKDERPEKYLAPDQYSNKIFTSQGFTGAVASFDTKNKIHNNFLVNSIKDGEASKPKGFIATFKYLQLEIVMKSLAIYIAKNYYDLYDLDNDIQMIIK